MSADRERSIEGVWWTPGESDRSYGTLVVERRALTLTLSDSTRPGLPASNDFAVLHGESLQGDALTLLDAITIQRNEWHGASHHNRERLRAGALILGAHVIGPEELIFTKARVRLRGLREWVSTSSPGSEGNLPAPTPRREPEYRLVVPVVGAKLTFGFTREAGGTAFRDVTDYDAEVMVELEEAARLLEWTERWVRPLQDLLVFANREQCVVESFVAVIEDPALAEAVAPAIRVAASDAVWSRHEIELVRPDPVELRERQIEPFRHLLLPLTVFRGRVDEVLPLWFDVHHRLGGAAAFFFGTLNAGRIYEENRLLNLLAFAEAYHRTFFDEPPFAAEAHEELVLRMLAALDNAGQRDHYRARLRYANSQSQRQRLAKLIERAAEVVPELGRRVNNLRNELVDTRNHYTHFGEPGPNVVAPEDLHNRIDRFLLVLEVNLLRDLGVDSALIPRLVAHAYQERIP